MMKLHEYPEIGEKLYSTVLPNGLEIRVIPKKDFSTCYAAFMTNYGGAHRRFTIDGRTVDTPAGVAHYLEHKMFDLPNGDNALSILSANGHAHVQDGRLASSGIEKYFEGIFISERIGYDKPDARYFDACFRCIPDFSKERAIMIGDSLTSDIRGGVNAGIKTCWFNPKNEENRSGLQPDYEIRRLQQIPELIERVFC